MMDSYIAEILTILHSFIYQLVNTTSISIGMVGGGWWVVMECYINAQSRLEPNMLKNLPIIPS